MIDWFTVIAQIVNFLILVLLLKYFLYGRILAAIDRREQTLSAQWDEAQHDRQQAAGELETAREKNRQMDEQREQLLAQVRDEVEQYRTQLMTKVRGESEEARVRWAEAIQEETDSFLRDLRQRTAEEVCTIARKALFDLAGADLEQQIVERFLQMIEGLSEQQQREVMASLEGARPAAVVQTSGDLPGSLQAAVTAALRRRFFADLEVQFETSPDLLCGIALQSNAHKLAWNLRDYLASLEQQLQNTLEEETATRSSRTPATSNVKR